MQKCKSISIVLFAAFIIFIFASCHRTVVGTGPVVTVKREANKFAKVDLQLAGNVMIFQGTENSVVIHAQQNIADAIETNISRKTLKIYSNKYIETTEPVELDITMNNLEGLEISGSGEIKTSGTINTPSVSLKVSGSGKIYFSGVSNDMESDISGSGEIHLKGSVIEVKHEISGSGKLFGYDMPAQNCKMHISGSGDAEVTVTSQLTGKISGSGSIIYKGNPGKVDTKISGSGTIHKAE